MIGRRRGELEDAVPDLTEVWATDTIPVDDEPTEFDWSSTEREPEPTPGDADPPSRRGKVIGVGIAAALLLVLGAIVVWPRGDDPLDEATEEPDAPPATLSTLPSTETTAPIEPESDPDAIPVVETDPDTVGDVELPTGDVLDAVTESEADPDALPISIELPPELTSITAPTEVVMTTSEGLVTLSLPSGRLRYVDSPAPPGFVGGSIIVTPDSAAYALQGTLTIVSREGAVFEVDVEQENTDFFLNGWLTDADGDTAFRVSSFSGNGDQAELIVSVEGGVAQADGTSNVTDTFLRSTVGGIANDTGGVYRTGEDGASERVSNGRAFTANGNRILLRECDATRSCSVVVLDLESGERVPVEGGDDALGNAFTLDLAPDGTAYSRQASDGAGTGARQIVALDGTILAETLSTGFFTSGSSWVADGSGIIEAAPTGTGLRFLDRATGQTIEFGGEELGQVFSYGVRYPDSELPPESSAPTTRAISPTEPFSVPAGLDLVVLGQTDRMAYVDLDAGTAFPWQVPEVRGGRPQIYVDGARVTVVTANDGFIAQFGEATPIDVSDESPLPPFPRIEGPTPGTVWAPIEDLDGGADERADEGVDHRLVVIGQLPAIDGPEISIDNSVLLGSDGNGGLLARVGGDLFAISADGNTAITSGELIALNGDTALVRMCDDDLTCSVGITDRATGTVTTVNDAALGAAAPVTDERSVPIAGTISPDATAFLVELPVDGSARTWAIVDIRNQQLVTIPPPDARTALVWNERSTYMAFVSDDDLYVYDRVNGRFTRIQGLGTVRAVAAVGADFAPEDVPTEVSVEQLES